MVSRDPAGVPGRCWAYRAGIAMPARWEIFRPLAVALLVFQAIGDFISSVNSTQVSFVPNGVRLLLVPCGHKETEKPGSW